MSAIVEQMPNLGANVVPSLVSIACQSTLLILVVAGAGRLWRGSSANLRYWLWQLVAFKLLLMPFWNRPIDSQWLAEWRTSSAGQEGNSANSSEAPVAGPREPMTNSPAANAPIDNSSGNTPARSLTENDRNIEQPALSDKTTPRQVEPAAQENTVIPISPRPLTVVADIATPNGARQAPSSEPSPLSNASPSSNPTDITTHAATTQQRSDTVPVGSPAALVPDRTATVETQSDERATGISAAGQQTQPPASTETTSSRDTVAPNRATAASTSRWGLWLFAAWVVGFAWQIFRVALQFRRLSGLLTHSQPADGAIQQEVDGLCAKLKIRRVPRVVVTNCDVSPFACGMLRPVIVITTRVVTQYRDEEVRQILLHELAHVKRYDLWWAWLTEMCRMVYFWHPLAYMVARRVQLERELACDQLAMSVGDFNAADYAETLIKTATRP